VRVAPGGSGRLGLRRLARLFLGLLPRLFHLLAQLRKRGDLVGLLLQVEVVNLLFVQVDDLAGRVVQRRLAIALDRHGRGDALARRLAAEQVDHPAEHAGELDTGLLIGANVGAEVGRGQNESAKGEDRDGANRFHACSSTGGSGDCTLPNSHATLTSGGAQMSINQPKPMRSKRNPLSAGPLSSPAPHAMLYNP